MIRNGIQGEPPVDPWHQPRHFSLIRIVSACIGRFG